MDPGWPRLSLPRHVPVDFLWPPLSLFRQSGQPATQKGLPAGEKSQNGLTLKHKYTQRKMIFFSKWDGRR